MIIYLPKSKGKDAKIQTQIVCPQSSLMLLAPLLCCSDFICAHVPTKESPIQNLIFYRGYNIVPLQSRYTDRLTSVFKKCYLLYLSILTLYSSAWVNSMPFCQIISMSQTRGSLY